jgi:galactokinase
MSQMSQMSQVRRSDEARMKVWVRVPGRVNLIGDHTDYTGGWVLPMTIDRWTVLEADVGGEQVRLVSQDVDGEVHLAVPLSAADPQALADVNPQWGRYVAAAMSETGLQRGLTGTIRSEIPVGAGLSSSAALGVALVLAMTEPDVRVEPLELAKMVQRVEHRATGVPTGIMDQLCIAAAREGHASLIDCGSHAMSYVPVSAQVQVLFVAHRTLDGSEYTNRVRECAAVEAIIGPLRTAQLADLVAIRDARLQRRARHVITENARVQTCAVALADGDHELVGSLMAQSHQSLAGDYEVSTPQMDRVVAEISGLPGVWGVRMTGGGFGGCVVALTTPETEIPGAWRVKPVSAPQHGFR